MGRYFCKLSFKGTDFHGWQSQLNASSVQETIENAITQLFSNNHYNIIGCGRTDTGVHAKSYFFHVDLPEKMGEEAIKNKLNLLLPKSIVIHDFYVVDDQLHARFSAKSRTYRYFIHDTKDPFIDDFSWYMRKSVNIPAMNKAATQLLGKQDFASFAKAHSDVTNTLCEVTSAKWFKEGNQLVFEISANRFLRNMVRAIVGTLLEVGTEKLATEDIKKIMAVKDRQAASLSVPPQGLFLWEINY
jgi:tRNA pseudouridine38-40 synthase